MWSTDSVCQCRPVWVCVCVWKNIKLRYSSVTVGDFVQNVRHTSRHSLFYCWSDKMERMDEVKCPCSTNVCCQRRRQTNLPKLSNPLLEFLEMWWYSALMNTVRVNLTAHLFIKPYFSFQAFFTFAQLKITSGYRDILVTLTAYSATHLNYYFVFCEHFLPPKNTFNLTLYCTFMHMHIYILIPISLTNLCIVINYVAVQLYNMFKKCPCCHSPLP